MEGDTNRHRETEDRNGRHKKEAGTRWYTQDAKGVRARKKLAGEGWGVCVCGGGGGQREAGFSRSHTDLDRGRR